MLVPVRLFGLGSSFTSRAVYAVNWALVKKKLTVR